MLARGEIRDFHSDNNEIQRDCCEERRNGYSMNEGNVMMIV